MTDTRQTPRSVGHAHTPLVALVVGVVLVGLAAPRLAATVADLPARSVMAQLHQGGLPDQPILDIAEVSRTASLEWVENGRGWADLGLLQFNVAERLGFGHEQSRERLSASRMAHRRALSLSPAQAYVWARLAHIELLKVGPSPAIGRLLDRAITTAPFDRRLAFTRLELCFLVWRQLSPEVRELAARQIRFAAGISPVRLAALARKRFAIGAVRDALIPLPALRRRVDYFLMRL